MLNIYELTSQYLNTDYLYGKSFRKAFLGFMGINPNARLYPLTELELMSFCLGTILKYINEVKKIMVFANTMV